MKQAKKAFQVGSMTIEQPTKPKPTDTPARLSLFAALMTVLCSIFLAAIVL